jgi:2-hydroxychromene-2-carboxylate isomerase
MTDIEFHFDFGSPNAYLAHRVIPSLRPNFRYVPILLGGVFKATNNRSPAEAFKDIRNKREFHALETRRFIARHAISGFNRNPFFPVNTLAIMRGAIAAERLGCFAQYVDVLFHNMWSEPKKLDEPDIARAVMADNDLPVDAILALSAAPEVKRTLVANTEASVARGNFGSPTFFVGDDMYFGKDQLRDAVEAAGG